MLTSQLLKPTGKATHEATGVTITDHKHANPLDKTTHHTYRFQLDWPGTADSASFTEGYHKLAAAKLRLQRARVPTDSGWTPA